MPALTGFLWLTGLWLGGEVIIHFTALPISSGVIGMLLLCALLIQRQRVPTSIAAAAQPLIGLLAMLIMPGVVGVFFIADELAGQWLAIFGALVLGTAASVVTTLWLLKRLTPTDQRTP
ncbi:CidA/LrgA family protein [Halomonas dongshanensis]|uniref:CidA/LrgA family protein n=1 Tax=Halomonas dongshanensis TaxID=2890835 RepID=A0ABT2EI16_9GAMM|nr:CidA/LrgA family protein [Halomonas dongshanensis]